jgi:PAS domain S-box-containing protein
MEEHADAVIAINQRGIVEFFNRSAEKISGYRREEVLKKNVSMLMPEPYAQHHDAYLSRYMETKIPHFIGFGRQFEMLAKTGEVIPVFLTITQIIVGREYAFIAFVKDYRAQKRSERESRQLTLIAKKTKSGIIITDKNRRAEWANEGFLKMSGYSMDELMGKNPGDLLQGKGTDQETISRMRLRLKAGEPIVEEILHYRKNREPFWAKLYIEPVRNAAGEVEKFIATEFDITQEQEMKAAVKLANEKAHNWNTHYKALIDALPDLMFIWDAQGNFIECHASEESREEMEVPCEELVGATIFETFPDDTAKLLHEHILEAIRTEKSQTVYYMLELSRGKAYFHARIAPLKETNKVLAIIINITERKQFEEDLRIAKERAEESSKAKEQFLANTSHEIRTPMNAIIGVTELLKKTPLTQQQLHYLGIIDKSAENLLNIINDILDISKIESNKLQLENAPFLMKKVIDSVVNTNRIKTDEKGIELRLRYPPEWQRVAFVGDALRLEQVLQNLVNNAVKFTHSGWVELSIAALSETDGRVTIRFEVNDTGIGISPDNLQTIFEEFTQADTSTTRVYGGTGLGLSISQRLVGLMGGELRVNSVLGAGTSFFFELPFEKDPVFETPRIPVSPQEQDLSGIRVLLVEDQEFNQFVARHFLESMRAAVDIASNGKQAIEKLSERDFDIVLMDIQMPVMDGVEATRFIREHMSKPKSAIPVIALTAHTQKDDNNKYLEMGMNSYLSKPFTSGLLAAAILQTLRGRLYDLSAFRAMPGVVREIVASFLHSTQQGLEELDARLRLGDYRGVRSAVHSIRPGFKMIGRSDVADMLERIETLAGRKTPAADLAQAVEEVRDTFGGIRAGLEREL